jgi:hypothetical protein
MKKNCQLFQYEVLFTEPVCKLIKSMNSKTIILIPSHKKVRLVSFSVHFPMPYWIFDKLRRGRIDPKVPPHSIFEKVISISPVYGQGPFSFSAILTFADKSCSEILKKGLLFPWGETSDFRFHVPVQHLRALLLTLFKLVAQSTLLLFLILFPLLQKSLLHPRRHPWIPVISEDTQDASAPLLQSMPPLRNTIQQVIRLWEEL